jgi:hypothetical protein
LCCSWDAIATVSAGFGDALLFGAGPTLRRWAGADGPVDMQSKAYAGAAIVGTLGLTVASGGLSEGASAGEGAGKVMIGETMSRVRAKAAEMGADVFETSAETAKAMWKENSSWLRRAMREGKDILDYGLDEARQARSKFYQAEKALLDSRNYPTTVVR